MLSLFLGIPASLLPDFYRQRWFLPTRINFTRSTIFSGLLECAIFGWIFLTGYMDFVHLSNHVPVGVRSLYGLGFVSLLDYLLRPLPLFNAFFAAEGFVRFAVAFLTGEPCGSAPLALLARLHRGLAFLSDEIRLGPRISDEVQTAGGKAYDLRIASCRPKRTWNHLLTIEYQGHLYEIAFERRQLPPRPFVYMLRLKPLTKVIRGLHVYSPDEALSQRARRGLGRNQSAPRPGVAAFNKN